MRGWLQRNVLPVAALAGALGHVATYLIHRTIAAIVVRLEKGSTISVSCKPS